MVVILAAGSVVGALSAHLGFSAPSATPTRQIARTQKASVTFNNEIVRILQRRCQSCHYRGGIAPFPLLTYEDAYRRRTRILKKTALRQMPPWSVDRVCAIYQDDPSLSKGELDAIRAWVDSGAIEGDRRDLPPPLPPPREWSLGEPDLKLTIPVPFKPDFAEGDVYRCFVFPTSVPEDHWVSGVAIRPGNPKMVHHALVWVEKGSSSEKLVHGDPARSYPCFASSVVPTDSIGEWVPGNRPHLFPEGLGRLFPKQSRVILQIHYSAHYAARSKSFEPDQSSVGIYFAKAPVRKRVQAEWVYGPDSFVIPAGNPNHVLKGSLSIPSTIRLHAVWPHMHLLGRTMNVTAKLPDGTKKCLLNVTDWDFHWQRTYWFARPLILPAGTRVELVASFDNSTNNPHNPNTPPRDATRGMATTNEMCQAALYFTLEQKTNGAAKK